MQGNQQKRKSEKKRKGESEGGRQRFVLSRLVRTLTHQSLLL